MRLCHPGRSAAPRITRLEEFTQDGKPCRVGPRSGARQENAQRANVRHGVASQEQPRPCSCRAATNEKLAPAAISAAQGFALNPARPEHARTIHYAEDRIPEQCARPSSARRTRSPNSPGNCGDWSRTRAPPHGNAGWRRPGTVSRSRPGPGALQESRMPRPADRTPAWKRLAAPISSMTSAMIRRTVRPEIPRRVPIWSSVSPSARSRSTSR